MPCLIDSDGRIMWDGLFIKLMSWIRPRRLEKDDKVAIVSPSSTIASVYPKILKLGIRNIRRFFDLDPVIFPHATVSVEQGYLHPELRAQDLNSAFKNSKIKGIFSTIGGDESIRILNHLDESVINSFPKFYCGFSDCTTVTTYLARNKICSVYGGAVMAGFAQMPNCLGMEWSTVQDVINSKVSVILYNLGMVENPIMATKTSDAPIAISMTGTGA